LLKLFKRTVETDEQLIELYRQTNDRDYIGRLFERYASFVFAISMKYLKDKEKSRDNTMVVFEKLLENLNRFDVKNFKAWLHMVTKNQCLMQIRSEKSKSKNLNQFAYEEESFMEKEPELHHDQENDIEINLSNLNEALKTLGEKQKKCIELFYIQEKSYVEVAEITGFTMNEVKSFIQNGKRNLKIYLTSSNAR
jgi:RNA polymerase sigma-70 factor (ECF subfamily)